MRKHPPWFPQLESLDPKKEYSSFELAERFGVHPNTILRCIKKTGCYPTVKAVIVETDIGKVTRYAAMWTGHQLTSLWSEFLLGESKTR